jgi:hypothetical protein
VIHGYAAIAAVDSKARIVVAAQAHGSRSEPSALVPMLESTSALRPHRTVVTADAGGDGGADLRALYERNVPALIADNLIRRRDGRIKGQGKYKELPDRLRDKRAKPGEGKFTPGDFRYDPATNRCICPAGKRLYSTGGHCPTNGRVHHKFQGAKRDGLPCQLRDRCLRHPERTPTHPVAFFAKNRPSPLPFTERIKTAIDSARGQALHGRRIATVEPVFANLPHNKPLDRFTLRSRPKVNAQRHLYCLVHKIEKLAHHGYAR